MDYRDKKVLILGLGKSGRAVTRFLEERGARTVCYDDGSPAERGEDIFCDRYDFSVISPGFPLSHHAVSRLRSSGVPILSELDLAYINCRSRHIFAISGTNGKTTTALILAKMLETIGEVRLVGNIGIPFVQCCSEIGERVAVIVEVSSFQIEQSVSFRPEIAALTNVGEDHLDRHLNAENYRRIKLSLLDKATIAVTNADDPVQFGRGDLRYSFLDPEADFYQEGRMIRHKGKVFHLPKKSIGAAYDRDFLCAFSIASCYAGARKSFLEAYRKTVIPHYRNEYIGTLCGGEVYNDSKGTNIDATLFAVSLLKSDAAIILGGSDKGEAYFRLMDGLGERVKRVYLVGANARDMYLAARPEVRKKCVLMSDLESCVADFARDPLKTLLFSPASASFDSYSSYEERGNRFNEIVDKYRRVDLS